MRWTYQPTVFNTNKKCSILSYSIQCQPKVFNTKAWQGTIFEQYSWVGHTNPQWGAEDSKGAVTIPSLSPHFALLLGVFNFYHTKNLLQVYIFYLPHSIPSSFFFFLEAPSPPQKILGLALPGSRTLFTLLHTCCDLQSLLISSSYRSSPNDLYNHHVDLLHHHYWQNDNIIKITIITTTTTTTARMTGIVPPTMTMTITTTTTSPKKGQHQWQQQCNAVKVKVSWMYPGYPNDKIWFSTSSHQLSPTSTHILLDLSTVLLRRQNGDGKQMQSMRLCICWQGQFHETFKNPLWRKIL